MISRFPHQVFVFTLFPPSTPRFLKGKVIPVHTMETYKGSRDIDPVILNLGAG
jgi:hypothetical protein